LPGLEEGRIRCFCFFQRKSFGTNFSLKYLGLDAGLVMAIIDKNDISGHQFLQKILELVKVKYTRIITEWRCTPFFSQSLSKDRHSVPL